MQLIRRTTAASLCLAACLFLFGARAEAQETHKNPIVVFHTSMGDFKIELYARKSPETVANFLRYVKEGYYEGTIFHRVIDGFIIQGGGYDAKLNKLPTHPPIKNEAANGIRNTTGSIAMARTRDPESATSQFFINLRNNPSLDHRDATPGGMGYAVFGMVMEGWEVVKRIGEVQTASQEGMADVPLTPIVIERIERLP